MSILPDGTYYIVNRVESPNGDRLVITFKGENIAPTVTPKVDAPSQKWQIKTFNSKAQYIIPQASSNLQAAWGNGVVIILPAGGYVWAIRSSDSGYTIKDGRETQVWGLNVASVGAPVTITSDAPRESQRWTFESAEYCGCISEAEA